MATNNHNSPHLRDYYTHIPEHQRLVRRLNLGVGFNATNPRYVSICIYMYAHVSVISSVFSTHESGEALVRLSCAWSARSFHMACMHLLASMTVLDYFVYLKLCHNP